jgi:hypothetical protein
MTAIGEERGISTSVIRDAGATRKSRPKLRKPSEKK